MDNVLFIEWANILDQMHDRARYARWIAIQNILMSATYHGPGGLAHYVETK